MGTRGITLGQTRHGHPFAFFIQDGWATSALGANSQGWMLSATSGTHTLNTVDTLPCALPKGILQEAAINVASAATSGGVARCGLYESGYDARPSRLVSEFGTVAVDSTGVKSFTSLGIVIPEPNLYWFALVMQSQSDGSINQRYDSDSFHLNGTHFTSVRACWSQAGVSGALPDPWTGTAQGTRCPRFSIIMDLPT